MIREGDRVLIVGNDPAIDTSLEDEGVKVGMIGTVEMIHVQSVCPYEVWFKTGQAVCFSEQELEVVND